MQLCWQVRVPVQRCSRPAGAVYHEAGRIRRVCATLKGLGGLRWATLQTCMFFPWPTIVFPIILQINMAIFGVSTFWDRNCIMGGLWVDLALPPTCKMVDLALATPLSFTCLKIWSQKIDRETPSVHMLKKRWHESFSLCLLHLCHS